GTAAVLEFFGRAAVFKKWSRSARGYIICSCPEALAAMYKARKGRWTIRPLAGVTTMPLLHLDGSLCAEPGYDEQTGLYLELGDLLAVTLLDEPSKQNALEAVQSLYAPMEYFPFTSEAAKAAALSAVLSAGLRNLMAAVPMHAYTAPAARTGKSLLID